MPSIFLHATEIVIRYICAMAVGLVFEMITGRFINHISMYGSVMLSTLALFMIIAIPIWHLAAKLLCKRLSESLSEVTSAVVVSALIVQPLYFNLYYSNVILPTVNEYTKLQMFTWYTATTTNITMATLTALIFVFISHVAKKWKLIKASH